MKISVLSLNPGIDRVMYLPSPLCAGHMNRLSKTVTSQGSKGANCAIMLKRLGCDIHYFSFTGGTYGEVCRSFTDREGINSTFIPAACGVRVNSKLIDGCGVCSELNEPGGPFTESELSALTEAFEASGADIYIMTGSLPRGASSGLYATVTARLKASGGTVVLDCSGKALLEGLQSGPDVIKPNTDELAQLCIDAGIGSTDGIEAAAGGLYEKFPLGTLLVTDGGKGSYLFTNTHTGFCHPSDVVQHGFSGAGDCFLSGFVYAKYVCGMTDDDAHLFASCCGGAKVMLEGSLLPDRDNVTNIFNLRKASH